MIAWVPLGSMGDNDGHIVNVSCFIKSKKLPAWNKMFKYKIKRTVIQCSLC